MFMESSKRMLMKYGRFPRTLNDVLVVYKETDMVPAAAIRCQLEVVEGQITQLKKGIENLEDEISGRGIPWEFYSRLGNNSDDVTPESKTPESESNEEVILNNSSNYGFSRSQLLAAFSLALFLALFVIFDLPSLVF
ncbi:hypothetical protein GCK72_021230 [Caenorhabditis remanei]|uniref:Uncharacterized protein n=1 Tax=Caenorhabditis remanei TaxID=31234 RepID=A0A6A5GHG2_CAERE|nr:hypothetical protein GCK72_021230 [Caenorhabditis remanei]KAF1754667.1 hypothetical protein GCK72_021230 [Caenorhabditis remanei]